MGLRCLIGHDFAPPETEREREERGDEVVVTVREFRECSRCGERRTISENTEVRTTSGRGSAGRGESPAGSAEESPDSTYDEVSAAEDDGVILPHGEEPERGEGEWPASDDDHGEAETEPAEWPDSGPADPGDDGPSEAPEWPEQTGDEDEPDGASEPAPWPAAEGEDEGYDAVAGEDSSVDEVEFGGGLTPRRTDDGSSGPAGGESEEGDVPEVAPAGITSASPGPEPTGPQLSDASAENVLVCPECGHEASGGATSLRPGDICPECRRGYLTERGER